MPDRKGLASTLWFACSLALMASVLVAPIRTPRSAAASTRRDCLRRGFSLSPGRPASRLIASIDFDVAPRLKALPSESEEEQDRAGAPDGPRVSFPSPCSFAKSRDPQLIPPRSAPSLHPLRC